VAIKKPTSKKITRQQKKEAKKRQAVEKQKSKANTTKKTSLSQSQYNTFKGAPSDYDGIEAIEPIEIPVDDDYSSDDEEPRHSHTEKKPNEVDESTDETEEDTVE